MSRKSDRARALDDLEGIYTRTQVKEVLNIALHRNAEDDDTIEQIMRLAIQAVC